LYPRTFVVDSVENASRIVASQYPLIAKPARPLSGFKVRKLDSPADLDDLCASNERDLPFLVQNWIPGGDDAIFFCALFLDRGKVLARFDGHKLRSRPMGHTTIAEPFICQEVYDLTARFFEPLKMSGPVSLELKRDSEGRYWIIEPTVGRTDFWLGVCVANGVNLPHVEYQRAVGAKIDAVIQQDSIIWLNTERDPLALPWYVLRALSGRAKLRRITLPFLHSGVLFAHELAGRAVGRLRRLLSPRPDARRYKATNP
jgi:D-aspartate ligase